MAERSGQLLIMAKHKGYYVALTDEGTFIKVRCSSQVQVGDLVGPGDVVWLTGKRSNLLVRQLTAVAAFLVVAAGLASWMFLWPVEAALIAVDINPSMELHLDTQGKVMRAVALNDDATKLLTGLSLDRQQYSQALGAIIDKAVDEGYLTSTDDNLIALSVVASDSFLTQVREIPEIQQQQVQQVVAKCLAKKQVAAWVLVQKASQEQHQYAASNGTSLNKVLIAKKGQELGIEGLNIEELDKKGIMNVLKEKQIPPGKVLGKGAKFHEPMPGNTDNKDEHPGKGPKMKNDKSKAASRQPAGKQLQGSSEPNAPGRGKPKQLPDKGQLEKGRPGSKGR